MFGKSKFVFAALLSTVLQVAAAPQVVNVETPVVLTGEIVAGSQPSEVALKLTTPIKIYNAELINGKEMGFEHHGEVLRSIDLWLGDPGRFPNPKVGTKGSFEVSVNCASAACTVGSIKRVDQPQGSTQKAPASQVAATGGSRIDLRIGTISVSRKGDASVLTINGKSFYDEGDKSIRVHRNWDYRAGDALLLLELPGEASTCPVKYRFVRLKADHSVVMSERFGTCSDRAGVKLGDVAIQVDTPSWNGSGIGLWTYLPEQNHLTSWNSKQPARAQHPAAAEACKRAQDRCNLMSGPSAQACMRNILVCQ